MDKVKVRVLGAVVDGASNGTILEIGRASAQHLVRIGYVELVDESKKATVKAEETVSNDTPESAPEEVVPTPKTPSNRSRKGKKSKHEVTVDSTEE